MKTEQWMWDKSSQWQALTQKQLDSADLVIFFGGRDVLSKEERIQEIDQKFPNA